MSDVHPLEQFFLPSRLATIDGVLAQRTSSLTVVLDRLYHAHNISAVVRSADAFGLTTVHILGETVDFSREISRGTERWVDVKQHLDTKRGLQSLLDEGFQLVLIEAANNDRETIPVYKLPFDKKLALVFGNEKEGIAKEIHDLPHISAHIPMFGFVESLNVSVAVALCLFCSTVSIMEAERRVPLLSESEKNSLRASWLENDLPHGSLILRELDQRKR